MIFTLGHSTLSVADFINNIPNIQTIADIRSHPTSSKWTHFTKEEMSQWLPNYGKKYIWMPQLGGWRTEHVFNAELVHNMSTHGVDITVYHGKFPKQRIAATRPDVDDKKPTWVSQGLYDYSWFMTLPEFHQGAKDLVAMAKDENVAIVCSEARWWRCHRSMVSDYLYYYKVDSYHIINGKSKPHSDRIGNRIERYDQQIINTWSVCPW